MRESGSWGCEVGCSVSRLGPPLILFCINWLITGTWKEACFFEGPILFGVKNDLESVSVWNCFFEEPILIGLKKALDLVSV